MTASLTQPVRTAADIPGLVGYELKRELNHGYFGRVYEAEEMTTRYKWAIKIIEKRRLNDRQRQNVLNEVNIMRQLNHKNIIRLKDFFDLQLHYVLVMELMLGGDLFERLEKQTNFTEEDARDIIAQVAEGIKYMHDRNVAHRDIKIENLMFQSPNSRVIKIGDFGLAKQLVNDSNTTTPCGTKEYMAPEMLEGTQLYSKRVDVWALGCLTYIVLFGGFPFYNDQDDRGRTVMSLKEKIHNGRYAFPSGQELGANVSDSARDIIRHCLQVDPVKRYTIEQFLAHPWIRTRQDSSPVLHSPAIIRETNNLLPNVMREVFNISMLWQREHNPAIPQPQQQPQPSHPDIHSSRIGPLTPIDPRALRDRREKSKRKAEAIHAQASPLDGAAEEHPPHPSASTSMAMSIPGASSSTMSLNLPMVGPSNKKPNVQPSPSDVMQT